MSFLRFILVFGNFLLYLIFGFLFFLFLEILCLLDDWCLLFDIGKVICGCLLEILCWLLIVVLLLGDWFLFFLVDILRLIIVFGVDLIFFVFGVIFFNCFVFCFLWIIWFFFLVFLVCGFLNGELEIRLFEVMILKELDVFWGFDWVLGFGEGERERFDW